jgi:hypothetical protein
LNGEFTHEAYRSPSYAARAGLSYETAEGRMVCAVQLDPLNAE